MKFLLIPAILLSSFVFADVEDFDVPKPLTSLVGCFSVSYRYVEDGTHDLEIKGPIEWVTAQNPDKNLYVLTHYSINEKEVFKHWREDWKLTAGAYEQKVYGPTDKLRYECRGKFYFNQLRCFSPNAAKPIRDLKRKDYDKLNRENILQLTDKGWVHSQINQKVTKENKVVAVEVGWNEYKRVDNKMCEAAQNLP